MEKEILLVHRHIDLDFDEAIYSTSDWSIEKNISFDTLDTLLNFEINGSDDGKLSDNVISHYCIHRLHDDMSLYQVSEIDRLFNHHSFLMKIDGAWAIYRASSFNALIDKFEYFESKGLIKSYIIYQLPKCLSFE